MYGADDMADRTSYRQMGVRMEGRVKKGVHRLQQKIPASIPSKYETILNNGGNNQTDGFGNRTNRFRCSDNELPGPGSYHKPNTYIRSSDTCGSVSKLGYGTGFVSKTDRFTERYDYDQPGPGQYSGFDAIGEKKSFNKTVGLSSFATSKHTKRKEEKMALGPGPGHYDTTSRTNFRASKGSTVFRSGTKRVPDIKTNTPSPGQYENTLQLSKLILNKKGSSAFVSSVPRMESKNGSLPGPGAYNSEAADNSLRRDPVAQARGSSMFTNTGMDRFGHALAKKSIRHQSTPGPGHYEVHEVPNTTKPSANNIVFKATASRTNIKPSRAGGAKPPGPAYYTPANSSAKSFLLNADKKWV